MEKVGISGADYDGIKDQSCAKRGKVSDAKNCIFIATASI